jgi:hypothetical protein
MATQEEILTWPTRAETAKELGVSLSKMSRLEREGRLHHVDGENEKDYRYDPDEIADYLENPKGRKSEESFSVERALVELIKQPREKIDVIQFDIIKGLRAELAEVRAELRAGRLEVEAALDQTSERQTAMKIMSDESAVKRMAGERLVGTLGAILGGAKTGIAFSEEQLKELVLVEGFMTDEQRKEAQRLIVVMAKKKPAPEVKPKPEITQTPKVEVEQ